MYYSNRFYKIIAAFLCFLIVLGIGAFVRYTAHVDVREYPLDEIEEGTYGYYNAVRSNVPAHNYEVIVLSINGRLCNLAGDVEIHYTDGECKVVHKNTNVVYGNDIDVYVPKGTIKTFPDIVMR